MLLPLSYASKAEYDCDAAISEVDIRSCAAIAAKHAGETLDLYYRMAKLKLAGDDPAIAALNKSQLAWNDYLESHCHAVYELWASGSIQNRKYDNCTQRLSRQRTYEIWSAYLTYIDSTPPVLPEPIQSTSYSQ